MRPVTTLHLSRLIIGCFISFFFISCAVEAVNESPTRYGFGVTTMPGLQIGNGGMSIHAVLGYSRVNFKGGGGHNNFLQVGPHFRWNFSDFSANGVWAGAEFTYLNVTSKYDGNSSFNLSGSGFTIGPSVGYRFYLGKAPLSVYLTPAFLRRGKLENDNMAVVPSGNGFYGKLGIDLHFMSLLTDKGR